MVGFSFSSPLQPVGLSYGHTTLLQGTQGSAGPEGWNGGGARVGLSRLCIRWREIVENSGTKVCWPGLTVHAQRGVPDQASPAHPRHGAAGSRTYKFQSSFCLVFLPKSIALLTRPGPLSQPCLLLLPSVPRALQTRGHSNGPPQPMPQLSTTQDCVT